MGKQGPCYHCGVTSTPLWRNGPPEKPVLCNACGSRWRTKGTLENYTPLHARVEMDEFEDYTGHRMKTVSIKNKEVKLMKRRKNDDYLANIVIPSDENLGFQKFMDDDVCNRSSSGSAISNSDSCVQFGSFDASDLTGPSQSTIWESIVPSKKRTCVSRPKQSSVEKLTRDLYTILHEQSSYLSGSSEEDLLLETDTPMVSVEIGHGSVLFRHPSAIGREEESEASSLTFENKSSSSDLKVSKVKDIKHPKWEKATLDKLQILEKCDSPLLYVDLKDIFNFEEFMKNLTNDEQEELLKYLPSVDVLDYPGRLRGMFRSAQFMENLSCFKKLLEEGVFDFTFSAKVEDRKVLKRLCLTDLTKSKWMEYYTMLKKLKNLGNPKSVLPMNVDRFAERENKTVSGMKIMNEKSMLGKNIHGGELIESEESCFHAKDLFGIPSYGSSGYVSDQDLLLDLPSHSSFPEAELLSPSIDQAHINTIRR